MRRISFIALGITSFFGVVAKAQKPSPSNRVSLDGRRQNNECPICGTMADPFKRPLGVVFQAGAAVFDAPYGPTQNIARCRQCNCAFWQDEEPKP